MQLARIRTPEYTLFFSRVSSGIDICLGRDYIVEFDFGLDHAELIEYGDLQNKYNESKIPGFRIVRPLNTQDEECIDQNKLLARKIEDAFKEQIRNSHVRVKTVYVRCSFDQRRVFIRYFAKNPLNIQRFAETIERDFKISVNLWQIGPRDETRLIGCIGHCGRAACCCSWIRHDCPVNLKMAKNQGISLNPASLNGTCNRLKCCFRFENDVYEKAAEGMPRLGATVICRSHDNFKGVIINRDVLQAKVVLRSADGKFMTVDVAECVVAVKGQD